MGSLGKSKSIKRILWYRKMCLFIWLHVNLFVIDLIIRALNTACQMLSQSGFIPLAEGGLF